MKKPFKTATGEPYVSKKPEETRALYRRIVVDLDLGSLNDYIKNNRRKLTHQARKITWNDDLAEDAVQDALLKVFVLREKKLRDGECEAFCKESDFFDTWVNRMVMNSAYKLGEKEKHYGHAAIIGTADDGSEIHDHGDSQEDLPSWSRSISLLPPDKLLMRLHERFQAEALLQQLEDHAQRDPGIMATIATSSTEETADSIAPMTYQEVADLQGVKIGTVRSRISRFRDRLQENQGNVQLVRGLV